MFVGNNLTNIRMLFGFSINELADHVMVSSHRIWQLECNYVVPTFEELSRFSDLFEVRRKYFIKEDFLKTEVEANLIAYRSETIGDRFHVVEEAKHLAFIDALLQPIESYVIMPQSTIVSLRDYVINLTNQKYDKITIDELIKEIAEHSRKFLGLNKGNNNQLLYLLENSGIIILEKSVGEGADAYSTWINEERPIIMLGNQKRVNVRRNFDLAHELGHLLLHYMKDVRTHDKKRENKLEQEANLFAGYFLLPEQEFTYDFLELKSVTNPDSYLSLKEKWQVSIQAIAYRANKLGLLEYDKYRRFNIAINRKGYKKQEPLDDKIALVRPARVKSLFDMVFSHELSLNDFLRDLNIELGFLTRVFGFETDFLMSYIKNTDTFETKKIASVKLIAKK
ncbi:XRE family transcriptional regulator [Shouchella sp. 1P09AA]|uniref:spr1629 family repressor/antitoxin n=1 Tax=unclassified Shouchella TaxID=2893065 RepID=UPI00399F5E8C